MIINGQQVIDTEERTQMLFDRDFKEWVKRNKVQVYDRLSDVMPDCKTELVKGQRCAVINGYNYLLHGYTIMGFSQPDKFGRCVYLNWDCYWFKKIPADIVLE